MTPAVSLTQGMILKGKNPKITLLGNNSGRNLGDAAILSSILEHLTRELPDAEFYVPSIKPKWIEKHYGARYRVRAVNVLPWTFSLRLLGIPTIRCFAKSDVALICDGIIFGKNLLNPAFNYLITLVFLLPFAKLFKCKLVCFNNGIGPFPSKLSEHCARWVINSCETISMREEDSIELARKIGVTKTIDISGDSAFINPVSSRSRAEEIASKEGILLSAPMLGVNVTKYIDSWLSEDRRIEDKSRFLDTLAEGLNQFKAGLKNTAQVVVFSTQPMDESFSETLAKKISAVTIDNTRYLSHDVQAIMRECDLLVGMRFHALVLASAVDVPIVGLVYAPKVRSLMKLLKSEQFSLELKELNSESLAKALHLAWSERESLGVKQQEIVKQCKIGARRAGEELRKRFFPGINELQKSKVVSLHQSPRSAVNETR